MYRECVAENDKLNYTFCRKQVQTIDEEIRIIRSCDCYWTKSPPTSTLVCQCDGDGCNNALNNRFSTFISIILPCAFILVARFIQNSFIIIQ
ncbi:hypothetical protein BLA29_012381 [Euroglyphus maynei]|uniref:Protein quiver n=1 Tax=Euroglyphus maynei TaxID=6958 RepID=A0A1Y3BNV1_EURMA|nr:hypothetical protein BLA29_012381 [Euroglyphus maynei]